MSGPGSGPVTGVRVASGGGERTFDAGRTVSIGRADDVDVTVDQPKVSRHHATLRTEADGTWVLEDRSTNGTYVDGQRVDRVPVRGPLAIRLGHPTEGALVQVAPIAAPVRAPAGPIPPGSPVRHDAVAAPPPPPPPAPPAPPAPPPAAPVPTPAPPPSAPAAPSPGDPFAGQPVPPPFVPPTPPAPTPSARPRPDPDPTPPIGTPVPPGGGLAPPSRPTPYQTPNQPFAESHSVVVGHYSTVHRVETGKVRIGRETDNDVVVADLLVSRYHAELRHTHGGQLEIVDLHSRNGTFVNGHRVARAAVSEGALISVGHHVFRLTAGHLEEYVDTGEVAFAAHDLVVTIGSKTLLNRVSFALAPSSFLAVLGPTGAGKTTLLRALTATRPANHGTVVYNGRDLYQAYAELRRRIGYVPQDDVLHPQLTVRRALTYAATLRFAPDVTAAERRRRVDEVMDELGLTARADLAVSRLSGGQRKRTSVALELLTTPSLLFLDEPTSGLDPGYEKSVMQLLRKLADGGRTIITITHSPQSLDMCDRVLFLAPGGQTAYFGPPSRALPYFHEHDYADVFLAVDRSAPGQVAAAFATAPEHEEFVDAPLRQHGAVAGPAAPATSASTRPTTPSFGRQLATLVRRYATVILADRRNLVLLLVQAPILAFLMLLVTGSNALAPGPKSKDASTVLLALVLAATYLGASNSIRELVKERAIYQRERAAGLSIGAYVLSKGLILGVLTLAQAAVLVVVGTLRQGGPAEGALFPMGRFELLVDVALAGLAAMGVGLLVSAFVSNADKALTILPIVLFAQFLLSGAAFDIQHKAGLSQISYLSPSRWAFSAMSSTVDLPGLRAPACPPSGAASACGALTDKSWTHSKGVWVGDSFWLVVMTGVAIGGAAHGLRRLDKARMG